MEVLCRATALTWTHSISPPLHIPRTFSVSIFILLSPAFWGCCFWVLEHLRSSLLMQWIILFWAAEAWRSEIKCVLCLWSNPKGVSLKLYTLFLECGYVDIFKLWVPWSSFFFLCLLVLATEILKFDQCIYCLQL